MEQKIYKQMSAIKAEISAISKKDKNKFQNYMFRGIDRIYNELHPLFSKHGVFCAPKVIGQMTEERKSAKGGLNIYRLLTMEFTFYADDGSSVTMTTQGEGLDSSDKASNKAMAAAHKYCLVQSFMIPTEEKEDGDFSGTESVAVNGDFSDPAAQSKSILKKLKWAVANSLDDSSLVTLWQGTAKERSLLSVGDNAIFVDAFKARRRDFKARDLAPKIPVDSSGAITKSQKDFILKMIKLPVFSATEFEAVHDFCLSASTTEATAKIAWLRDEISSRKAIEKAEKEGGGSL